MKKYIVRPGDTMWSISKRTEVRLNLLMAANPQYSSPGAALTPGQIVMIPELTKKKSGKMAAATSSAEAPSAAPMPSVQTAPDATEPPSHHGYQQVQNAEPAPHYFGFVWPHVVRPGETWASIAKQYGVSQQQLQQLNPKETPDTLNEGDMIYVPATGSAPSGTMPSSATGYPAPVSPDGMTPVPGYAAPPAQGYPTPAWPSGMMPMPQPGYPGAWPAAPTRGVVPAYCGWPYWGWAPSPYPPYEVPGIMGDFAGE